MQWRPARDSDKNGAGAQGMTAGARGIGLTPWGLVAAALRLHRVTTSLVGSREWPVEPVRSSTYEVSRFTLRLWRQHV